MLKSKLIILTFLFILCFNTLTIAQSNHGATHSTPGNIENLRYSKRMQLMMSGQSPTNLNHSFQLLGRWTGGSCTAVVVKGSYAYTACNDGFRILNVFDPESPVQLSLLEIGSVLDVEVDVTRAYALVQDSGLSIIDVSDRTRPVELGFLEITSPTDVALFSHYAYVTARDGLHIVDVARLDLPVEAGFFGTDCEARGLYIDVYAAYVVDSNGLLHIVDVIYPHNPVEIGSFHMDDAADDVVIADSIAFIANGPRRGLRIVDVSDFHAPVELGFFSNGSTIHEIIVGEDIALLAYGEAGLILLDISNPRFPLETGHYDTGSRTTGLDISGRYLYVTDEEEGLYILTLGDLTGVENGKNGEPASFVLRQNYPNPFNAKTCLSYRINESCRVILTVQDLLGRTNLTLIDEFQEPGDHSLLFDAGSLLSGTYIVRLNTGIFIESKKIMLIR